MFNYSAWPWDDGRCQDTNCPNAKYELAACVKCLSCNLNFCEFHTVDACRLCGMAICSTSCFSSHTENCQKYYQVAHIPKDVHIWCNECRSMLDFGINYVCEGCQGQQCLNEKCRTQVATTFCCGRHLCQKNTCAVKLSPPRGLTCRGECPILKSKGNAQARSRSRSRRGQAIINVIQ